MAMKDWKLIDGKRYYRQSIYTNKLGAKKEAKERRKKGQSIRIIKDKDKYGLYIRK